MNYENQNFPYFLSKSMYNGLPERQIKKVYHDIRLFTLEFLFGALFILISLIPRKLFVIGFRFL